MAEVVAGENLEDFRHAEMLAEMLTQDKAFGPKANGDSRIRSSRRKEALFHWHSSN